MNVLQSLLEFYNHSAMDSTYRYAAGGILEKLSHIQKSNVHDIAEYAKSSRTTLWRMSKKLGYKNFDEFHHMLKTALRQFDCLNRFITQEGAGNIEEIRAAAAEKSQESLEILNRCVSDEKLRQMTALLHRAQSIHFYLPCPMMSVYTLQQNLFMDGKKTVLASLPPDILAAEEELNENSIVFIFSQETTECFDYQKIYQKAQNKNSLVWMLGLRHSRYKKYADETIIEGDGYSFYLALEQLFMILAEIYRITYIDRNSAELSLK